MDDTKCNTQNRWRSVDANFQIGAVTMSLSQLPTMAANTLIVGKCCSTALESYKMQHPRLLTLCWRSVDDMLTLCWRSVDGLLMLRWGSVWGEGTSTLKNLRIKATNISIRDNYHSAARGWFKMQHTKSWTFCCHSFSDWGFDHVASSLTHKCCQYVDYG
jgi:hypothetical protein